MASLTPGVLSKLLKFSENAQPSSEQQPGHDSKLLPSPSLLLQVVGILPAMAGDDLWPKEGFYIKVSDSTHATYVSLPEEQSDLILSDKIRLGQLIEVEKLVMNPKEGRRLPILCGVRPVPGRHGSFIIGSPQDLQITSSTSTYMTSTATVVIQPNALSPSPTYVGDAYGVPVATIDVLRQRSRCHGYMASPPPSPILQRHRDPYSPMAKCSREIGLASIIGSDDEENDDHIVATTTTTAGPVSTASLALNSKSQQQRQQQQSSHAQPLLLPHEIGLPRIRLRHSNVSASSSSTPAAGPHIRPPLTSSKKKPPQLLPSPTSISSSSSSTFKPKPTTTLESPPASSYASKTGEKDKLQTNTRESISSKGFQAVTMAINAPVPTRTKRTTTKQSTVEAIAMVSSSNTVTPTMRTSARTSTRDTTSVARLADSTLKPTPRRSWDDAAVHGVIGAATTKVIQPPTLCGRQHLEDFPSISTPKATTESDTPRARHKNQRTAVTAAAAAKTTASTADNGEISARPTKIPVHNKGASDRSINNWDCLPSDLIALANEVICKRDATIVTAKVALEEASAAETVLKSASKFAELCSSAETDNLQTSIDKFLDLQKVLGQATTLPDTSIVMKNARGQIEEDNMSRCTYIEKGKRAQKWVEAALSTNLAAFTLMMKQTSISSTVAKETCSEGKPFTVVLEGDLNTESSLMGSIPSFPHQIKKANDARRNTLPSTTDSGRRNTARSHQTPSIDDSRKKRPAGTTDRWVKGCSLQNTANLAKQLQRESQAWFLKFLEAALDSDFHGEYNRDSRQIVVVLSKLKRSNDWLDQLNDEDMSDAVGHLQQKIYDFLLRHVELAARTLGNPAHG